MLCCASMVVAARIAAQRGLPRRHGARTLMRAAILALGIAAVDGGSTAPVAAAGLAPGGGEAHDLLPARPAPVRVAIDAGHGGTSLGAPGPVHGLYEKNVTLALAERVQVLLESGRASPRDHTTAAVISAVLCRASDQLVPIRARARCAAESGARLFISLHANAVPAGVPLEAQSGFEIFVLGPREVEDDAALAALHERDDARAALAAHQVRAGAEQSIRLASHLARQLTAELGGSGWRGVKQSGAALDVLRGTAAASVLVEVGFLSHPVEGMRLATAEGREPVARALAAGIRAYVEADRGRRLEPSADQYP
jgi:N-acetylmuramoyl-L-alanine amidase